MAKKKPYPEFRVTFLLFKTQQKEFKTYKSRNLKAAANLAEKKTMENGVIISSVQEIVELSV